MTYTNKIYCVISPDTHMDCGTDNIIYLVSCKKCGVQYVGETGQTLRKRLNNHRNRLKQLCGLYLYHHFNSDGHTIEDLNIMPIEEVIFYFHTYIYILPVFFFVCQISIHCFIIESQYNHVLTFLI